MSVTKLRRGDKPAAGYRMVNRGSGRGEIYLYGIIGVDWFGDGVSSKQFADDLKKLGKVNTIDLRINSEGGDVFAGKAMYTLLVEHDASIVTHVDGLAASAASFVAMAGDKIKIAEGGFMMVHNAWTWARGNAADLTRMADLLRSVDETIRDVYAARTGNDDATIAALMDEETWMDGKTAVQKGFADEVVENMKVAAMISNKIPFEHPPSAVLPRRAAAMAELAALKAARD